MSSVADSRTTLGHLSRQRDLWWQFTLRAIEMRHRGSHLGMIWSFLNPLLMLTLYAVVFGVILGGGFGVLPNETKIDYVLALFLGLILYQLMAETITVAPTIIVSNPNLVKKVVFPLPILPLAQLGAAWFHLLISLGLLIVGALAFGRGLTASALWLPVVLFPLVLMSVGMSWLLSALGVFFRDLTQIMPFVAQITLYASAVVYSQQKIFTAPPILWAFLKWNPLLHTVQLARDALLWPGPLNLKHLAYTYVCGIALFLIGRRVFQKLQPAFADVI
jgi:lipopolysaccharide transport system permease protein